MTITEIALIITAMTGPLGLIVQLVNSWILKGVKKNTDGMVDKIVSEAKDASFAEGKDVGREAAEGTLKIKDVVAKVTIQEKK